MINFKVKIGFEKINLNNFDKKHQSFINITTHFIQEYKPKKNFHDEQVLNDLRHDLALFIRALDTIFVNKDVKSKVEVINIINDELEVLIVTQYSKTSKMEVVRIP